MFTTTNLQDSSASVVPAGMLDSNLVWQKKYFLLFKQQASHQSSSMDTCPVCKPDSAVWIKHSLTDR